LGLFDKLPYADAKFKNSGFTNTVQQCFLYIFGLSVSGKCR